jgi:hypothetical protein
MTLAGLQLLGGWLAGWLAGWLDTLSTDKPMCIWIMLRSRMIQSSHSVRASTKYKDCRTSICSTRKKKSVI